MECRGQPSQPPAVLLPDDRPGWQHFSTGALPPRDRFAAFCEEIIRRQVALDAVKRKDLPFDAVIEACDAGPVDITRVATTTATYVRTPALMRDGSDDLFAVVCLEGSMRSTQGEGHHRIGPGDGVICDSAEIGGLHMETTTRYWAIRTARANLASLRPGRRRWGGTRLDGNSLARRLLAGYLGTFYGSAPTSSDRTIIGGHMIDLIALALRVGDSMRAGDAARTVGERRGLRAARLDALLRAIETCSGNPGLSAASLASRLGVTPRYIHVLLEETGQTFSRHVLNRRLERALGLLRDRRRSHLRITDIAGEAGFADLSYFNRSFRRRFGDTPSGARARLRDLEQADA
ncbi:MAG TPA: AraC family transcriptional regulator [Vineibacter sp.]|nr:AraC family transcriptional regulator [Vineibacter sp.]